MIHQFVELGDFYRKAEGVDNDLAQYAKDAAQTFGGKTVLVLVFSNAGFEDVIVEEYDPSNRLRYLALRGPSNGFEPTATAAMPKWNPKEPGDFEKQVEKKLNKRLAKSAESALSNAEAIEDWERHALVSGVRGHEVVCACNSQ
jgi:hypothetical protein